MTVFPERDTPPLATLRWRSFQTMLWITFVKQSSRDIAARTRWQLTIS